MFQQTIHKPISPSPVTTEPSTPDARALRARVLLRRVWRRIWPDEMEAYLSKSSNLAEFEYRVRQWDEPQRRQGWPQP